MNKIKEKEKWGTLLWKAPLYVIGSLACVTIITAPLVLMAHFLGDESMIWFAFGMLIWFIVALVRYKQMPFQSNKVNDNA